MHAHRTLPAVAPLLLSLLGRTPAAGAALVRVQQTSSSILLRTKAATVEITRAPLRLQLRGRRVHVAEAAAGGLFYERAGATHQPGAVTAVAVLADGVQLITDTDEGSLATVTVRFLTPRTVEVALDPPTAPTVTAAGERFAAPAGERFYGLTERLRDSPLRLPGVIDVPVDDLFPPEAGSLDRRGETVEMRVLPTFSIYAPFYQSSAGYGLAVAGTTFGLFDLAKSDPSTVAFRFETGTTPASRRFVYHLFVGPDYATVLDEYTSLVGRPIVPPDWAFLHWRWRDELTQGSTGLLDGTLVNGDVADDVTMYDTLGIPPGVYHFDRPVLTGNYGFAAWQWDETRLPNPDAMLQSLRSRGYHLMIWSSMWSCGSGAGENGLEAQLLGYDVPGTPGTPDCADLGGASFILDPTNPEAQAWWRDRIAAFLATYGIQGIKLDRGEEHIPSEATDVYADGRTGREVHNDYPGLQTKIHYDALAQAFPDGDFVLFSRPAYTGTAQWSIFWGGDIPGSENFGAGKGTDLGLRSAIISQERAAFLGVPIWGSDTGGYYQFKDRDVFARWIEFSAFSGVMEIGGKGTHAPWNMPTTPAYDQQMIDIYRRYTTLRATLQPYIVQAAQAARTGMPIVRPMPFVDRRDKKLADTWDEYLFGPDLLVAPVWKTGTTGRLVYFPRGTWRGYWDRTKVFPGRRTVKFDVPLDTILVFVRAGADVPGP